MTTFLSFFVLFSLSRWTSRVAPLPAHPHPEAAGLPWGPPASAVHRLLPGSVGGAAVASWWPGCDNDGRQRCLPGGDPSPWLLSANQVHRAEREKMSWELFQLIHQYWRSWNTKAKTQFHTFPIFFQFYFNWSHEAQMSSYFTYCYSGGEVMRSNSQRQ